MNFTMAPTTGTLSSTRQERVEEILRTMYFAWMTPLLLLGGFGNIVTILVMQRSKDKNNPSSPQLMLQALAVVDLSLLWLGGLELWLLYCLDIVIFHMHSAVCKLESWLIVSLYTITAWMVTAVTVQRTIAVRLPHRMGTLCPPCRTRIAIAVIVIASFCAHAYRLVGMEVIRDRCRFSSPEYRNFATKIWTWVNMAITSLLPSLCQFVCDVLLSITLLRGPAGIPATSRPTACRKMALRTTITVLLLSVTFLLLTLPVFLVDILYTLLRVNMSDSDTRASWYLARGVVLLLWYTNSAVNFLLYCATGGRFRRGVVSLLRSVWTPVKTCPNAQR